MKFSFWISVGVLASFVITGTSHAQTSSAEQLAAKAVAQVLTLPDCDETCVEQMPGFVDVVAQITNALLTPYTVSTEASGQTIGNSLHAQSWVLLGLGAIVLTVVVVGVAVYLVRQDYHDFHLPVQPPRYPLDGRSILLGWSPPDTIVGGDFGSGGVVAEVRCGGLLGLEIYTAGHVAELLADKVVRVPEPSVAGITYMHSNYPDRDLSVMQLWFNATGQLPVYRVADSVQTGVVRQDGSPVFIHGYPSYLWRVSEQNVEISEITLLGRFADQQSIPWRERWFAEPAPDGTSLIAAAPYESYPEGYPLPEESGDLAGGSGGPAYVDNDGRAELVGVLISSRAPQLWLGSYGTIVVTSLDPFPGAEWSPGIARGIEAVPPECLTGRWALH